MSRATFAFLAAVLLGPLGLAAHFTATGPGGPIPDFVSGTGIWNSSYTGAPFSSTVTLGHAVTRITSVRLLGLQHPWRGDLHLLLRSPNGTYFNLVVRPGSDGYTVGDRGDYLLGDYELVDAAGTSVQQGATDLQPGAYDPYWNTGAGMWTANASNVPLASISGPAGAWRLEIRDWAGSDVGSLAGWTLEGDDAAPPIASFCSGDGALVDHTTPCPCGNDGSPGKGCANSVTSAGAVLGGTGVPANDGVVLTANGMPTTAACVFLQGDALADAVFGDGVRCVGGMLLRLRTRTSAGGTAVFPNSTDTTTLAQRGGVVPGSGVRRWYQTYYRNSAPLFCPPETFNVTSGVRVDW